MMNALGAALGACLLTCTFAQAVDEPAKKQLTVKDEKLGISVGVKGDDRILVAKDKEGKILWEVDVIKTAGAPAVGQPVIRDLSLKDGKVGIVYGKHSFADFDLKSGKLLSSGSD
jgi:hypothetical protein